jgi:hypothetical protein
MATGDVNLLREVLADIRALHENDARTVALVDEAIDLTYRQRYKRTTAAAKARSERSMTDDEIKEVIRYARLYPTLSNRSVGRQFGIDGGRVSEYLGSKCNERLDRLRDEVRRGV